MAFAEERTTNSWKNVNNWHWVDKDCLPWTREFIEKKLEGLEVKDGSLGGMIDKVNSVTGDAVVNQRKGKFTCVYDLEIRGELSLSNSDSDDKIKTYFTIAEFAYDTKIAELEVEYRAETSKLTPEQDVFLKTKFTKAIGEKLNTFVEEAVNANYKDIFVQDIKSSTPGNDSMNTAKANSTTVPKYTSISQTVSFSASPKDIFECLTSEDCMRIWSRSPAKSNPVQGGQFSLLDGRISGKFKTIQSNEKIVQSWRLSTWDTNECSQVTIDITANNFGCKLTMFQESVPYEQKDVVSSNWSRFYWWPIRDTYGFGCTVE